MIRFVRVIGYQSLSDERLELGRLTVVTGHTGSGKSSLIRAIRLLAFNARGTSYIRRGVKQAQVVMQDDDGLGAAIVRGAARGSDAYVLQVLGEQKRFTKLNGEVPEAVSRLLALTDLNFAGQFDRPFLLDESGGKIARTLGELTNVTLIFGAAREANRRRLEAARQLRDSQQRLEQVKQDAQRFRGLPQRRAAVKDAEEALSAAQETQRKLDRLSAVGGRLASAVTVRDASASLLEGLSAVPLPDLDELFTDPQRRLHRLRQLLTQVSSSQEIKHAAQARASQEDAAVQQYERQYGEALRAAGRCPVCGSTIPQEGTPCPS